MVNGFYRWPYQLWWKRHRLKGKKPATKSGLVGQYLGVLDLKTSFRALSASVRWTKTICLGSRVPQPMGNCHESHVNTTQRKWTKFAQKNRPAFKPTKSLSALLDTLRSRKASHERLTLKLSQAFGDSKKAHVISDNRWSRTWRRGCTHYKGKSCIDTRGVWFELVQPLATQYFPDTISNIRHLSRHNLHSWWRHKDFFGRAGNVAYFSLKC